MKKKDRLFKMAGIFLLPFFFLISCHRNLKPDFSILQAKVQLYNKFLIWQKFDDAEKMMDTGLIPAFEKTIQNKRYTSIKIIKIKPVGEGKEAEVIVKREYYYMYDNRVRKELIKQKWKYRGKRENWVLVGEERL